LRPPGARAPKGSNALYPLSPAVLNWLHPPPVDPAQENQAAAAGAADSDDEPSAYPRYPVGPPTPTTEVDEGEWAPAVGERAVGVDVPPQGVERPPGGAEDEQEHPAEEARAARPSRDPGAPTQAMRDAHASTHLPFRSWCDECVQGRRDAPPHCRQKRSAGEIPEVAFDYAFIRRDDEEALVTCLVMRDRDSKAVRAWVLERKGADTDETVDRAVAGIRDLGYRGRVLIRCDGEPALVALRNAIITALPEGATPVKTPVAESASNGGIEQAIRTLKGMLRVHLAALERNVNAKFPSNHPALTWLVEHVADVISKYMVGVDGKTAYERLYGRPVREEGLEFGETLHWRHRPTKDMNVVLDMRWSSGVWLGRKWGGIVHQVYANGKVHEIRGVQRQPRELRWQRESLEVLASTPWCREPAAPGELRVLPPLAPPAAGAGRNVPEVAAAPEYNPYRVFIKLTDLERHGFTAGCRRCILMREGRRAHGIKHQDACRDRVEQALRDAGDPRLDRAEARVMEELGRRAAGVEALPPPAGVEVPPQGVELPPGGVEPGIAYASPAERALAMQEAARGLDERAAMDEDEAAEADAAEAADMVMRLGPAAVAELYSPPRVTAALPRQKGSSGLVAGSTFDLQKDEAGIAWDFTRPSDRKRAWERIREERPFLVVGSPPCTMFSRLQLNLNAKKMGKAKWEARRREAEVLLMFAVAVYRLQVREGRHFLHEHPAGASSWSHPAISKLRAQPGVDAVVSHMCAFGMETTTASGTGRAAAKKPTRFMSSSTAILEALSRRCAGDHPHAPLLGGTRARDAAVYPPDLCRAIVEGAAEQLRRDDRAYCIAAVASEVHCDEAQGRTRDEDDEVAAWAAGPAGETFDEITGAVLPPKLVQQARAEEIKFMLDWKVWQRAPITDCWRETGRAPIGSKWVDVNKGDAVRPLIRSRFVVKEIATYKSDDFFAATPPLEAFRLLLSLAASSGKDTKIEVLDARKAHLHAFADRTVFTQLPPEVAEPGFCARLVRCLYGTRDAPKRWEAFLAEQLVALGFAKGRASPCCYYHATLGVRCIVHGDDFVLTGSAEALDEVKVGMHKRFLLKELGRLGSHASELKELRVLNRVVRWTREGLKYEADPRHAEIIVQGIVGAEKALSAPGTASKEFDAPGDENELPEKVARLFRSFAARANYLALDRPDISQATKELCRRMSAPRAADLTALLRVARYLAGAGRVVYEFPWQHRPVLSAYTDSDFAGCVATRRSTSGGAALLGTHLLKHWASTQKKITLSSGEAELGAVVRGFSEALGLQSIGRDLGVELQPEVHADSSAAIGICHRCGIGKVRHLAVAQLWVQDLVRAKDVRLHKVLGTLNPADLMTKPLPRAEIDGHLTRLGLSRAAGRAETAPRADAEVDKTLVSCRVGPSAGSACIHPVISRR
jgi:hypothetical protein